MKNSFSLARRIKPGWPLTNDDVNRPFVEGTPSGLHGLYMLSLVWRTDDAYVWIVRDYQTLLLY
ncbi:8507_t:CDS:1, partial [Funneliformis caledonium]